MAQLQSCHGAVRIVGEKQACAARQHGLQKGLLFVDQQLGMTVVAHGHRHMHPWLAGDEVGAEHHAWLAKQFRHHQARRMTITEVEMHRFTQRGSDR